MRHPCRTTIHIGHLYANNQQRQIQETQTEAFINMTVLALLDGAINAYEELLEEYTTAENEAA